jgi:hypothetical protein
MSDFAPIILFVYARPEHTRRTIEALARNDLAEFSDLVVYADAARSDLDVESVKTVKTLIRSISGFRSVTLYERPTNFGLAKSIIDGVTEVLNTHERVIVLEDDLVTSPYFLTYMNNALELYAEDFRVVSIHGYFYPVSAVLPDTFFLPGADCWGWATWRRGWSCFNHNGAELLQEIKQRKLERFFDYEGNYPYVQMLKNQVAGFNDSWAIRWYASTFLQEKLTLYPGRSLVLNIGTDGSGTHSDYSDSMNVILSSTPICLDKINIEPSVVARQAVVGFFKSRNLSLGQHLYKAYVHMKSIFSWIG